MSATLGDAPNTNNQQQQAAPIQPQVDTHQEAPIQPATRGGFPLAGLNSTLARPLGRSDAGAVLASFSSKMKALFEDDKYNSPGNDIQLKDFRLVPIDHKVHRTTLSVLAVAYPIKVATAEGQINALVVHGLILEASDAPLAPTTGDFNGRRYDITKVPGDIITDQGSFLDRVQQYVSRAIQMDGPVQYVSAGFQVVPREANLEDPDTLRNISFYAAGACVSLAAEKYGLQEVLDLSTMPTTGVELEINPDFSAEQATTLAGLPKCTNVRIGVAASIRDADGPLRQDLTDVAAQISLIYTPPAAVGGFGSFSPNQPSVQDTRHFTPLIELTRLDTQTAAITLELQNLGILSSAVLTQRLEWLNAFRVNRHLDLKDDLHDVGALALAVTTEPVNTRAASFDDNAWLKYLGALCHESAAIAIRVEDAGELSWMNGVYVSAGGGDLDAARVIYQSFQNLTGKRFGNHYAATEENLRAMFSCDQGRLIDGYYLNRNGEQRDLSEVDMLYVLNATGDLQQALQFQDTFDDNTTPIEYRLEQRQRILESILGAQNVKIKGYSTRVYVNPAVIAAGTQAIRDLNINIARSRNSFGHASTHVRGNHTLLGYAGNNLGGDLFSSRRPGNVQTANRRPGGVGVTGRY